MPTSQPGAVFPKVKFLTVIWGEKYIERFCALSLPSFIAAGNLPALARTTQLEVVIMTRGADIGLFESNLSFRRLKSICPVRFVEIDDLITTTVYGVTLTLAYARPIIACGSDMLETHFVFMNADFVLANGSLQSLAKHIHAGRSIVLGPSYRAIAEELEPALAGMVDAENGVLDVSPRKLVGMALLHPHRTTVAKTFNQRAFSSSHPNQLFWQVDEHTVLGRYFLIFMLCLKPERIMESVNCYCDYSFIPELCPSGDEVAMGDSDDFFMLELQNRTQETFMLRQGELSPRKIAGSLQEWATAAHRRAASYDIVFHSRDLPHQIGEFQALAAKTVEDIRRRLGKPKPYQNHHYWVMGIEAWKDYRKRQELPCSVPELAPYRLGWAARYYLTRHRLATFVRQRIERAKRWATGLRDFVQHGPDSRSPCSPYRTTVELFRRLADVSGNLQEERLVVGRPDHIRSLGGLPDQAGTMIESLPGHFRNLELARFDQILFIPESIQDKKLKKTLARLLGLLKSDGSLTVFLKLPGDAAYFAIVSEIVFELGELTGNHLHTLTIKSAGGWPLHLSNRLSRLTSNMLMKFSARHQLLAGMALAPSSCLAMTIAYLANTFASSCGKDKLVKYSFGVSIRVQIFGELAETDYRRRKPGNRAR